MRYSLQAIARIVQGELLNDPPTEDVFIEHLLLDSRQVIFPASSVFIALQGRRHDGHEFLEELYEAGVRHFIVSRPPSTDHRLPSANCILVKNTHHAFHRLARHHRQQFQIPVVGITGSNGKTIVKEWLFQLLHPEYRIVRSPRSFNSQTGVPLSVLQMEPEHDLALFEAGISKPGEMEKLAAILDPTIGIFTNIGEAHSEGFPDLETKLREKLMLFINTQTIIHSVDNELVANEMQRLQDKQFFTWSDSGKPADLQVLNIHHFANQTRIEAIVPSSPSTFHRSSFIVIPFADAASTENALHCWALLLHLGYEHEVIAERMARLEPVAMRLELKEALNGCTVINDSYNSDLTSLNIALNFLEQQSKAPKRTLILSDILQSGQKPRELYGTVARLLLEKRIDRLIGIGKEVTALKKYLPASFEAHFYPGTEALLDDFQNLIFKNEIILLKGARHFGFENIANRLAIKFHKTVLEVNLGALLHNLRVYQSRLLPGTKMMVMVKAGAYGSGSAEVAKLLEFQNVDYLGVAYADEGVALRKAGIQLPILVMNPEEATFEALVRYRLEPEIYSLQLLENFLQFLQNENVAIPSAIHLKLDTGMHRLGFEEGDIESLVLSLQSLVRSPKSVTTNYESPLIPHASPLITVKTIFSHLAASESPMHDDFTEQQVRTFNRMFEKICASLGYFPIRHILNSSGIVRFSQWQMEMVRLGIGLYGVDSSRAVQDQLQTVNTLKATISQVKNVALNETVGYGRMGRASRPMRIATLSLGYADGLLRRAGNGQFSVLVHGKKAPIVGNVCMDMTMVDVTDITEAAEGDTVVIFGKDLPVQELAAALGTIPYEIFTTISERVKRVYVQE